MKTVFSVWTRENQVKENQEKTEADWLGVEVEKGSEYCNMFDLANVFFSKKNVILAVSFGLLSLSRQKIILSHGLNQSLRFFTVHLKKTCQV